MPMPMPATRLPMLRDAWVLGAVALFLDDRAVALLTVSALEYGDLALARLLLYPSTALARHPPVTHRHALHLAIGHACWRATLALLRVEAPRPTHQLPIEQKQKLKQPSAMALVVRQQLQAQSIAVAPALRVILSQWDNSLRVTLPECVMLEAARSGHLEAVIWLHAISMWRPRLALIAAASRRHVHIVDYLLRHQESAHLYANVKIKTHLQQSTITRGRGRPASAMRIEYILRHGEDAEQQAAAGLVMWATPRHARYAVRTWYCLSVEYDFFLQQDQAPTAVMVWAAQHGALALLQHLHQHEMSRSLYAPLAIVRAAEQGHLAVVQWLHRHRRAPVTTAAIRGALRYGHLEIAQWLLLATDEKFATFTATLAAQEGQLEAVRWIEERFPSEGKPVDGSSPLLTAASGGYLEIVQFCVDECGYAVVPEVVESAGRGGYLVVLQWLLQRRAQEAGIMDEGDGTATRTGHDMELRHRIVRAAATGGHTKILQWMDEDARLWHADLLVVAAQHNRVGVLSFLYSLSHDLSALVPLGASYWLGKPLCLQTAEWILHTTATQGHEHEYHQFVTALAGQAPALRVFYESEKFRYLDADALHWLQLMNPEQRDPLGRHLRGEPAKQPQKQVVRYRRPQAARVLILALPSPQRVALRWVPEWAILSGSYDVLKVLAQDQHPRLWTTKTLRTLLAYCRNPALMRWFVGHDPIRLGTVTVVKWAATYGHVELLQWLLRWVLTYKSKQYVAYFRTAVLMACRHGHVTVLGCIWAMQHEVEGEEVDEENRNRKIVTPVELEQVWRDAEKLCDVCGQDEARRWLEKHPTHGGKRSILTD